MKDSLDWADRVEAWLANDSAVISLSGLSRVKTLVDWLDEHGLDSLVVDLSKVRDKQTLMSAFQHDLGWPDWFGANWDALSDLLMGDQADDARHNVLILINPADFMAQAADTADTLMSLIEELSADSHSLLLGAILISDDRMS